MDPNTNDLDSDLSSDDAPDSPDVISSIYKSMSQIIEALNADNLILNQQVNKIRSELEYVCNTVTNLKKSTVEISTICTNRTDELNDIKNKIAAFSTVQKNVLETRNMLMQTLDANIKAIKKDITDLRTNLRPLIVTILDEELKAKFR